ncbi:hypothetical protein [Thermophagus xiamenensis]|uniref:SPOR domain-containing protein n=1 Tax=Thermophagus xiamenensis TaxID=385682 RepID=A0A1I1ZY64_9BACT|nr:hypothetical protein [Thermophagus xiamenensis]SFE36605.1 hypothetical protein SAMN05444380_11055 [Thermophagus xiamenensis]
MKKKLFAIVFFLSIFLVGNLWGQQDSVFLLSADDVYLKYGKKLKKVEKKIRQGEYFYMKSDRLKEEIDELKSSADEKPMRLAQMEERMYRLQLKASTYYEDANKMQLRILKKYMQKEYPTKFKEIEDEVKYQFRQGYVIRERGVSMLPGQSPLSFAEEAYRIESKALQDLTALMVPEKNDQTDEKEKPVAEVKDNSDVDEADDEPEKPEIVSETLKNVKPNSLGNVEKNILQNKEKEVGNKEPGIYFSIQFLATKKKVNNQQVKDIYSGPLPVIEVKDGVWYKFSAGRFNTTGAAIRKMKEEGIYGFIVAFEGNRRISLTMARRLLQKQ